jgi:hypothetical protein
MVLSIEIPAEQTSDKDVRQNCASSANVTRECDTAGPHAPVMGQALSLQLQQFRWCEEWGALQAHKWRNGVDSYPPSTD